MRRSGSYALHDLATGFHMSYVVRRLGLYLFTAFIAVSVNFVIPRLMPGNPVALAVGKLGGEMSPSAMKSYALLFGIKTNQSLWSQYVGYWNQLVHGNLGISFTYFPEPVSKVIAQSLPWTLVLMGGCTVISFLLGTAIGIVVGWRRGSPLFELALPGLTVFSAVPYFWLGLVSITIFSVDLHWFPLGNGYTAGLPIGLSGTFLVNALYHAALPALTIVLASLAGWALVMRNMMVGTLSEDYVVMAEAKGLRSNRIMISYGARNAVIPSLANFANALGFVVSGAIVVEVVFNYPGIGYELFQAVTNDDYPLMQGIFLIIVLAVLAANLLADLAYLALDPRVREEG